MIQQQSLSFGLIAGLLLIAGHAAIVAVDPTLFATSAILGMALIIPVVGQIILSIVLRRQQAEFKLQQSFVNLWVLSVIALLIYLTYSYVDYNFLHPNLNAEVVEYVKQRLTESPRAAQLNPEELEKYKIGIEQGMMTRPTLWGHATSGFLLVIMHLFAAVILSLLVIRDTSSNQLS